MSHVVIAWMPAIHLAKNFPPKISWRTTKTPSKTCIFLSLVMRVSFITDFGSSMNSSFFVLSVEHCVHVTCVHVDLSFAAVSLSATYRSFRVLPRNILRAACRLSTTAPDAIRNSLLNLMLFDCCYSIAKHRVAVTLSP